MNKQQLKQLEDINRNNRLNKIIKTAIMSGVSESTAVRIASDIEDEHSSVENTEQHKPLIDITQKIYTSEFILGNRVSAVLREITI